MDLLPIVKSEVSSDQSTTWKVLISVLNLKMNWISSKEMPESVLLVIQTHSLLLLILTSDALPLLLSQKSPILKNWKMSFSRRICISPNLVQATPIRRNLLHYLSYKAKLLSRVSKMYSSISKVLVPCFC